MIEAFETSSPQTVGIEEELMLLDPATGDLAPVAAVLLDRLSGDPRYKLELPAAQFEIVSPPLANATEVGAFLGGARRDLISAAGDDIALAASGAHPFAAAEGELNTGPRYDRVAAEYGRIARRQLVFGLQVHVAVRGPDRALAVYNALRSYLPELVALSANAPFYGGEDSGLATVRPKLCELLPRQGVPPSISSWEQFAAELEWGARSGAVTDPAVWWWELRPHLRWGTLELRVPDAQASLSDAIGVVAFVHALVAWLVARHDAGEPLPVAPTWRIEENRWQALARGGDGLLADLITGEVMPARERLASLVEAVTPAARALGSGAELAHTRALIARGGHERQHAVAADGGMRGLVDWLIARYSAA